MFGIALLRGRAAMAGHAFGRRGSGRARCRGAADAGVPSARSRDACPPGPRHAVCDVRSSPPASLPAILRPLHKAPRRSRGHATAARDRETAFLRSAKAAARRVEDEDQPDGRDRASARPVFRAGDVRRLARPRIVAFAASATSFDARRAGLHGAPHFAAARAVAGAGSPSGDAGQALHERDQVATLLLGQRDRNEQRRAARPVDRLLLVVLRPRRRASPWSRHACRADAARPSARSAS